MANHRGLKRVTRRAIATELRALVDRAVSDDDPADDLAYLVHGVLDIAQRVYAVDPED